MITLIDLSHPIKNHMPVYPGDEAPQIEGINSFAQNGFNNYRWTTSMHIGTHIDGPMHMTESKQFIGDIPPERCMGTGYFIDASGEKIIPRKNEYESHVQPDSIVVIYTGFGKKFGSIEYHSEHPIISTDLACLFVEKRVKMICLDTPSPDRQPHNIHTLLLKNRVLVAENLTNLDRLLPVNHFEIIAFPLRICADSSPARIVARILE